MLMAKVQNETRWGGKRAAVCYGHSSATFQLGHLGETTWLLRANCLICLEMGSMSTCSVHWGSSLGIAWTRLTPGWVASSSQLPHPHPGHVQWPLWPSVPWDRSQQMCSTWFYEALNISYLYLWGKWKVFTYWAGQIVDAGLGLRNGTSLLSAFFPVWGGELVTNTLATNDSYLVL